MKNILILILLLASPAFAAELGTDVRIQVPIKAQTEVGEYNSALYFTPAEYAALTQEQIDAMKQARVSAWVEAVKNPPVVEEPIIDEPPVEPEPEGPQE
jgi:hypothetical protein